MHIDGLIDSKSVSKSGGQASFPWRGGYVFAFEWF